MNQLHPQASQSNRLLKILGWYHLSFKERVLFAFVFVMTLVVVVALVFLGWTYRRDKIAYIFENHFLRTDVIAQRTLATLGRGVGAEEFVPETTNPAQIPKLYKIPRLPEDGEFFVANIAGKLFVISRDENSADYRKKVLNTEKENFFEGEGIAYISTFMGDLVSTTRPDVIQRETFQNRPGIKRALDSGLVQGFFTIKEKNSDIAFGYREVPGTNLLVFVETSLAAVMAPVNRFLAIWLLIGALTSIFGVGLMLITLRGIAKPIEAVLENLVSIAKGDYNHAPQYVYKDEFQKILGGLSWLSHELSERETGLLNLQKRLQEIVVTTQKMASANDRQSAAYIAAESIVRELKMFREPSVYVVNKNEKELTYFSVISKGERASHSEYSAQLPKELNDVKKEILATTEEIALLKGSSAYLRFEALDDLHTTSLLFTSCEKRALKKEDVSFLKSILLSLSICFENLAFRERVANTARLEMELEMELQTAQIVQEALIHPPSDVAQIQHSSFYKPASKIGGDWYGHYHDTERDVLNVYSAF